MRQQNRETTRRFFPLFEALEDRTVPAISVTKVGATLKIRGDVSASTGNNLLLGSADKVTIKQLASGRVNVVGQGTFEGIKKITVDTRKKDDTVTFSVANGVKVKNLDVQVKLGTGNDTFTGTLTGTFNAAQTIKLQVLGDTDDDTLAFTATDADVVAGAVLDVDLQGEAGRDSASFTYTGDLDGTLKMLVDGGIGDDNLIDAALSADLTFEAGSTGTVVPGSLIGGIGDDKMSFKVTKLAAADTVSGALTADTGAGTDTLTVNNASITIIATTPPDTVIKPI